MWPLALSLVVACKHNPEALKPLTGGGGTVTTTTTGVAPAALPASVAAELAANFARVHFASDSFTLDASGREALARNAALLREHRDVRVEVQGHADERGTVDYNLALGQKRGKAVFDALVAEGVAPSRVWLVSYGEERPLAAGAGEVAWAENRRAEFRVLTGVQGLHGTVE